MALAQSSYHQQLDARKMAKEQQLGRGNLPGTESVRGRWLVLVWRIFEEEFASVCAVYPPEPK